MVLSQLAAVIFDFDGVLANSEPIHLDAFRAALATRGWDLPLRDYYDHFLGYNDEEAFAAMAARYAWPLDDRAIADLAQVKLQFTTQLLGQPGVLYPDAPACVRRLAGAVPLAIASGAKREEIELVLAAHGLREAFRAIVASGETAQSKPAPDPYVRAVERLQEDGALPRGNGVACRCVAIEDSRWGLLSAKQAGLRCVGVTTSYAAEELNVADFTIDRLEELTLERLDELAGAP